MIFDDIVARHEI